jgi:hypothetical protein
LRDEDGAATTEDDGDGTVMTTPSASGADCTTTRLKTRVYLLPEVFCVGGGRGSVLNVSNAILQLATPFLIIYSTVWNKQISIKLL